MRKSYIYLFCLFFAITSCGTKKEVPNEIIEWLPYLYSRLSSSCREKSIANEKKLRDMESRINLSIHTTQRVQNFLVMQEFRKKTKHIVDFIRTVKDDIENIIGNGFDKEGILKEPYRKKGLYEFMINAENKHNAEQLQKELDEYYEYVKSKNYINSSWKHPFYRLQSKSFASVYFADKPFVIALLDLVAFEDQILDYEYQVFSIFTPREVLRNTRFHVAVDVEQNKLRAGEDYKAHLYITQFPSWIDVSETKMWVNGTRIRTSAGVGEVKFKAAGKGKQRWNGEIRTKYLGKDTVFTANVEYEVIE